MSSDSKNIVRLAMITVSAAMIFLLGMALGRHQTEPNRAIRTDVAAVYALRFLGLELKDYARDHAGKLPATLAEVQPPLFDPFTQTEFKYVGSGRLWHDLGGDCVLAYTSDDAGDEHQYALFSGGYASRLSKDQLSEELRKLSPVAPRAEQAAVNRP
jgi:hypothetical protein